MLAVLPNKSNGLFLAILLLVFGPAIALSTAQAQPATPPGARPAPPLLLEAPQNRTTNQSAPSQDTPSGLSDSLPDNIVIESLDDVWR